MNKYNCGMHKYAAVALVGLLALGLTGCGDDADTGAQDVQARGFADVQQTGEPEADETAEPDAATTTDTEEPAAFTETETAYLELARGRNDLPEIAATDDATLVSLGHQACDALAATPDENALRLFEGEQANPLGFYNASATVGVFAGAAMCPGLIPPQQ